MNVQRLEGEYMLTIILHKRPALNNIALLTLPKLLELHSPPSHSVGVIAMLRKRK